MDVLFQNQPQLQPQTDKFLIKGWFKKTDIIKSYMERSNLGAVPCYICNKLSTYNDIIYTRTLPKHLFINTGTFNVCVVCNECSLGEIVVIAPKNLEMIQIHYTARSKIGIIDLVKEKSDLVRKKEQLTFDIDNLKIDINKMVVEQKRLSENLDIEKSKIDVLSNYENKNKQLYTQMIENADLLKKHMNASFSQCNQSILTTYTMLKSNYTDILIQIDNEKKQLEKIINIEMPNNYPCNICFTNKISKVLEPCGHTICEKCILIINDNETIDNGVHCPFCKTVCSYTRHIFI